MRRAKRKRAGCFPYVSTTNSNHPHAFPPTVDSTASHCTMAPLTRHRTSKWTLEDVTIPRALRLVTTTALPHASLTESIRHHTTPLSRLLQIRFIWTCTPEGQLESPEPLNVNNTHKISSSSRISCRTTRSRAICSPASGMCSIVESVLVRIPASKVHDKAGLADKEEGIV